MAEAPVILLVEDDPFLSALLKTRLQNEGLTVMHAMDGQQAIEMLKASKPSLILLDLILPKKSGFEVMEAIQSDPELNKSPIIIISNLGQESDLQRGKELGAIEYFVKAKTSIDDLVTKIRQFVISGAAQ
ncbi:MAG: response regulator [bacterium]|nr:response regulator [bacterium]